ncbi:16S rRNA (cytidine(1402)-2'-O)-methyltransferase [Chamaesiphon sp. GL140_3_metabinner_50]|uniref:16S rRNA (cytidine(1402)-2'-O)-methyltransferase n=1 Tax=Chamaesiphon sp. GL140_3_metabinner_50 TaxID=2970812 RepID=UPI0025DF8FAB|nr:16S rRNA (cytidine(1402)-2'-O)-methyltransferase [Chamaesiphon sp. GL140_3_metabinner_50]
MSNEVTGKTLYLVGTPIGNLGDLTMRGLQVLRDVDTIAAEDTRHTGKLLHHFEIKTPQISYHQHNEQQRIPELLDRLQAGKSIALVTDAGMPGISDPGYLIVSACVAAGIRVIPIPGVTAVITAVSASGLPSDRFVFEGFIPVKGQERRDRLESVSGDARTLVFYESPHRLRQTLADFATTFGEDRQIVIGRELTKLHEDFWRGSINSAIEHYTNTEPQGEYTLVVAGAPVSHPTLSDEAIERALIELMLNDTSRSQASRIVAEQISQSRRYVYQLALAIDLDAAKNLSDS